MELISYIILICFSAISIITESKLFYKWIFIPSVVVFMIIVRLVGFDLDLVTYALEMHSTSMDLYYLREFIFWLGSRLVYYLFQDELISFLFMDLIWIITILKVGDRMSSFKKDNLNNALLVVLMTSFPFVFGYENIYRQFYAIIFALFSYSLICNNYKKSLFFFVIAFFMHNIIALLIPIFMVKKFYRFNFTGRIQLSLLITFLIVASLGILEGLKSVEKTGAEMGIFYFLFFVILLSIGLIFFKHNIYLLFDKVPSLFFIVIIMLGLIFLDADMIAERIGMMYISFLIYDLYKYSSEIEDRGVRSLVRLSLMLLFTLPTLFFESSLRFLI